MAGKNKVLSSNLENVGQGHNLQKWMYLSYYTNDSYQSFVEMKAESSVKNIDRFISIEWYDLVCSRLQIISLRVDASADFPRLISS